MKIPQYINASPARSMYLVSFDEADYDEYNAFVVVAYTEEEADLLTPNKEVNYQIGQSLGYDCPEPDYESVRWYRDSCGTGKSIERIEEAGDDLKWGYIPYSSYKMR
jgi:hypothetical protein